jgi:outer membrane protein OmpA-like peptidoglycan-associated protein
MKSFLAASFLVSSVFLLAMLALTTTAQDLFKSQDVRIINPGAPLNHAGLDYAPIVSADGKTLYFVSNRPGSKKTVKGDVLSHDFWASLKASRQDTLFALPYNIDSIPRTPDNGLNTAFNEGVMTISPNRRLIFFTGCERPDVMRKKKKANVYDLEYECDIYYVELKDNGEWGIPRNLGPTVNSEDWDGHPSLSPTGDRLYFASTRPGGFGDADIWYSDYDPKTRSWQKPKNAGKTVNTAFRDWSPFIAPNNRELYFASDGHKPNYGGTDFYVTVRDAQDKWSAPKNLGQPINTAANEAFISTPAQRDVIYFSSERKDVRGAQGSYDVFMAYVPRSSVAFAMPLTGSVMDGCSGSTTTAVITVYNPLTKRIVKDTLDGKRRTSFETIITDFDFSNGKTFVDTASIQLFAENAQFGRLYKELRIKRPVSDQNGLYEVTELAPVQFVFTAKPELAVEWPKPDQRQLRPQLARQVESGFAGFAMEEVVSVSVNRILNYVFFDEGSSVIPARYKLFKTSADAASFDEEKLRGETLDKYYHTLNVFGARLKANPKSTITIVGCLSDEEMKNEAVQKKRQSLAKDRADAVFEYLKSIWGISDKRMRRTARDLPAIPSNRTDSLGTAENRRVEILCDDWEITRPVVDRSPTVFTTAPQMTLNLSPTPPETVQFFQALSVQTRTGQGKQGNAGVMNPLQFTRKIVITRGGKLWHTIPLSATTNTLRWNWRDAFGEYPQGNEPLEIRLVVSDKFGRECVSEAQIIPVRRITTEDKKRSIPTSDQATNKTLERYNLIMFPFDKSDVGPMNARIIKEYVLPRLLASSETTIVGHTDVIGEEQYNQRLSESRGANAKEEVARLAKTAQSYKSLESKGVGEAEPLFDNSLPEGRFYNRTVQVIIETPVADVERENK